MVVGDEGWMTERIAMRERQLRYRELFSTYIVSPLDMAGMIEMAHTLAVTTTDIIP